MQYEYKPPEELHIYHSNAGYFKALRSRHLTSLSYAVPTL